MHEEMRVPYLVVFEHAMLCEQFSKTWSRNLLLNTCTHTTINVHARGNKHALFGTIWTCNIVQGVFKTWSRSLLLVGRRTQGKLTSPSPSSLASSSSFFSSSPSPSPEPPASSLSSLAPPSSESNVYK